MKRAVAILAVLLAVVVAAVGGYSAGFREAWGMGIRVDAGPRGVIALSQLRLLEKGRLSDIKVMLEHDIDRGLIHWYEISASPVSPAINLLSGTDVFPEFETYIRRLATYRKDHPSSQFDLALEKTLIESAEKSSSEFAEAMKQGGEHARRALTAMIGKYGQ